MKRKAPLLAGIALLAAVVAVLDVFGKDGTDAAWGFAVGIGIGALVTWYVERDGGE
jgi:hypothetical protein